MYHICMQQINKPGPSPRIKSNVTVHISLNGVEWDDLKTLAVLSDTSRSHLARVAIRHLIAHPEMVLPMSPEVSDVG